MSMIGGNESKSKSSVVAKLSLKSYPPNGDGSDGELDMQVKIPDKGMWTSLASR